MKIEVVEGDILSVPADVAIFKFAQRLHGADRELAKALGQQSIQLDKGAHRFLPVCRKDPAR